MVFQCTTKIPDTMKTKASTILIVIGSYKTRPPSTTPAIGMMKIKACRDTAPYFLSMVFQATNPNDAVIRLW